MDNQKKDTNTDPYILAHKLKILASKNIFSSAWTEILDRVAEELEKPMQEIVRCKDCNHGEWTDSRGCIYCNRQSIGHSADWYCADGEREEVK